MKPMPLREITPSKHRKKFVNDIYILQGIDRDEYTHIIAIFERYDEAKKYCIERLRKQEVYFDIWIERHTVL